MITYKALILFWFCFHAATLLSMENQDPIDFGAVFKRSYVRAERRNASAQEPVQQIQCYSCGIFFAKQQLDEHYLQTHFIVPQNNLNETEPKKKQKKDS